MSAGGKDPESARNAEQIDIKRLPPKKSKMDKENLDPLHKEAKLHSKTAIKPKGKLSQDQKPKRRNSNPIKIKIKFH